MTDITRLLASLKRRSAHAKEFGDSITFVRLEDIDALVEALEKAQRANGYLREQSSDWEREAIGNFEDCEEMSARVEELESQRKLAFAASNRWADKFREAEKRIAELESRTVTVKLPSLNPEMFNGDVMFGYHKAQKEAVEFCAAAGIKVEVA
ncbi:hypothetical protein P6O13_001725 [Klebsiella aerogenes]|nr:hypothetical protein [Klebsiella aerogenes]